MIVAKKKFMVPAGYLKSGDLISRGENVYEFVGYIDENREMFGGQDQTTFRAKVLTVPDGKEKAIQINKSHKVEVLNDQPAK